MTIAAVVAMVGCGGGGGGGRPTLILAKHWGWYRKSPTTLPPTSSQRRLISRILSSSSSSTENGDPFPWSLFRSHERRHYSYNSDQSPMSTGCHHRLPRYHAQQLPEPIGHAVIRIHSTGTNNDRHGVRQYSFSRAALHIISTTGNSTTTRATITPPQRGAFFMGWMMNSSLFMSETATGTLPRGIVTTTCRNASTTTSGKGTTTTKSSSSSSRIPFLLADIGEGIAEVELLQWFVQPGDEIRQFDSVLCQVQSDKATVDITSRYDGIVLELAGNVGDMIAVGSPLIFLQTKQQQQQQQQQQQSPIADKDGHDPYDSTDGDIVTTARDGGTILDDHSIPEDEFDGSISAVDTEQQTKEGLTTTTTTTKTTTKTTTEIAAPTNNDHPNTVPTSPAVRHLCSQYGIRPESIPYRTGPQGRLLKADVIQYVEERQKQEQSQNSTAMNSTVDDQGNLHEQITGTPTPSSSTTGSSKLSPQDHVMDDQIVSLRGYTRVMAKTMTESLQIPHMCLSDELDVTRLVQDLHTYKKRNHGAGMMSTATSHRGQLVPKISLFALLIKACSLALTDYPIVNAARHSEMEVRYQKKHHIGIAMDTPRGLVVPVIKDVDQLSIAQIQEHLDFLKANRDTVSLDQVPTFTLSNIGALGAGLALQPIIVSPQLAMGAVGRLQRLPRFAGNDDDINSNHQVKEAFLLPVSWAGDHRYLDGATLARFHLRVQQYLQDPWQMLVQLK